MTVVRPLEWFCMLRLKLIQERDTLRNTSDPLLKKKANKINHNIKLLTETIADEVTKALMEQDRMLQTWNVETVDVAD